MEVIMMKKLIYSQEDVDLILSLEIQEKEEQITQLTNNWNELEEWLEEEISKSNLKGCSFEQTYITGKYTAYKKSLNKMKEIKGGNNE